MIEQQGNLLDFEHLIAHWKSAYCQLGACIESQIKKRYLVYSQERLHVQIMGQIKYVYHLITNPRRFHKATYQSLRKALDAMSDHLFSFRLGKLGLLHLACGLENLEWTEVKQMNHEILGDLNFELTIVSLETSTVSNKLDGNPHHNDLNEAQTQDVDLKQVETRVFEHFRPPRLELKGFNRDVWKLWNLFNELIIHNHVLCRRIENPKTPTTIFQQVAPSLVPEILHSLHFDRTIAHLGVTKILEKVRPRFYWPGHKRGVVEVFVGSCLFRQKRNSFPKKHIHSHRAWEPSFYFPILNGWHRFCKNCSALIRTSIHYPDRWSIYQVARSSCAT